MTKIEDLELPEHFKQWDQEPKWFQDPDLELSGPFWSIVIKESDSEKGQYDLIVSCFHGESVYHSVGTDLEIVKNKATLLYNQVIRDLKDAVSTNEPN